MPPRLQPSRLAQPSTCQWSCTRTQSFDSVVAARSFHTSPRSLEGNLSEKKLKPQRSTLLRREMAAWLAGPGYKFRRQFPGSTNYLSAYDKLGNLVRRGKGRPTDVIDPEEEARSEERALKEEEDEDLDEAERSARAEGRAADRERRAAALKRTPRERASDMRPYPLNSNFRSQPVLSEELREELYRQIVIKKMDLQSVSAAYGVDMRRVAAVVRLKTVEKQWIEDVSLTIHLSLHPLCCFYDDYNLNRLVFKTSTWLHNISMRASLTLQHTKHFITITSIHEGNRTDKISPGQNSSQTI
jgi:hypothetical protein